jgi:phage tail sheath protein FI
MAETLFPGVYVEELPTHVRPIEGVSTSTAAFLGMGRSNLDVRCDRTTMTQEDLDSGRFVMIVGVAPIRPAEFVVLRFTGQTARKSDEAN